MSICMYHSYDFIILNVPYVILSGMSVANEVERISSKYAEHKKQAKKYEEKQL